MALSPQHVEHREDGDNEEYQSDSDQRSCIGVATRNA
jgi:hypothetical protein